MNVPVKDTFSLPPTFPIVEIDWLDSQSTGEWQSLARTLREAETDTLLHHTCGYLIANTDDYLLVAGSLRPERIDGEAMVADVMQIPRVAVLDMREIRAEEKEPTVNDRALAAALQNRADDLRDERSGGMHRVIRANDHGWVEIQGRYLEHLFDVMMEKKPDDVS